MGKGEMTPEVIEKAELLLDELRAESPLRHRLTLEFTELQSIHAAKNGTTATKSKGRRRKASAV